MTTECTDKVGQICERMRAVNAELDTCRERLRLTAQILVEEFGASGPANADDLARIAAAEVAKLRAEVNRLTVANANYEINVSAMWSDYKGAVADRERYRAALVELTDGLNKTTWSSWQTTGHFNKALEKANEILSYDSGPIAGDGK